MQPRVEPFFHAASHTFSYLVAEGAGSAAAIIDPVLDYDARCGRTGTESARKILDQVERQQLDVAWILETHAHADHLSAGHWLRERLPDARLAIGEGIRAVQASFKPLFGAEAERVADDAQFDQLFGADESFRVGDLEGRVIPVPGHTSDSSAYLIGDALFVGDSLFLPDAGTARCDFPGGNPRQLYHSIQRLFELPEATRVFVCHDYGATGREVACETTIGKEKRDNIHVGGQTSEDEFVAMRNQRDAALELPELLLPAIQVNMRAGALPPEADNGIRYLKIPLNRL